VHFETTGRVEHGTIMRHTFNHLFLTTIVIRLQMQLTTQPLDTLGYWPVLNLGGWQSAFYNVWYPLVWVIEVKNRFIYFVFPELDCDKYVPKAQSSLHVSMPKFPTLPPEDEYLFCGRKQINKPIQSR
jgi:hypothetical protein